MPGCRCPLSVRQCRAPRRAVEIDGGFLALDLSGPLVAIGVGEVGREADHRGDLPGLLHHPCDWIDVRRREAAEEAVVVLDALAAERRGVADPLRVGPPALCEVVEVTLRKQADAWRHVLEHEIRTILNS